MSSEPPGFQRRASQEVEHLEDEAMLENYHFLDLNAASASPKPDRLPTNPTRTYLYQLLATGYPLPLNAVLIDA